jgi:signal transduction histidine kinase
MAGYGIVDNGTKPEDMATLVLHELRAPLGLVATAARAAIDGDDDDVRRNCALIGRIAERMLTISATIIDAARSLQDDRCSWFAPMRSVERLVADLRDSGIPIAVNRDPAAVTMVTFGSREKWETLIHSFLANALDHMARGTRLDLDVRADPDGLVVAITNQAGPRGQHRGAGLGLLFCERLATDIGASATTFEAGGRFTATVRLPAGSVARIEERPRTGVAMAGTQSA